MSTKSRYNNGMLEFYDGTTHERVLPLGETVFFEDFYGYQLMQSESGSTGRWLTVQVNLNAAMAIIDAQENGVLRFAADSDSNAEDAVLYMGDIRSFNLKAGLVMEFRARLTVTPTLTGQVVAGMAGDHNLDKDAVTEAAWFKWDGSTSTLVEIDDTTNNDDDNDTGEVATTTAWHIYRIDFTDISDVKFFIDGSRVLSSTTFDMSNLSDAEAMMQPYFSYDKGADAGVGTFDLDYVRIWSKRST